jgi:hypothetical protein
MASAKLRMSAAVAERIDEHRRQHPGPTQSRPGHIPTPDISSA